jgi:hypothetical protein
VLPGVVDARTIGVFKHTAPREATQVLGRRHQMAATKKRKNLRKRAKIQGIAITQDFHSLADTFPNRSYADFTFPTPVNRLDQA